MRISNAVEARGFVFLEDGRLTAGMATAGTTAPRKGARGQACGTRFYPVRTVSRRGKRRETRGGRAI